MSSEGCCVLWVCTVVGVFYVGKWTLSLLFGLLTCLRVVLGSRLWKRNLAAEYGGKWAVVTGSTDGIGKEYARQLAQNGMKIILISRKPEKLKKVEEEIINNVGFFGGQIQKFNEVPEEDVWTYLNVNVASVVAMTKLVLPQMLARRQGAIINISSIFAVNPVPLFSVYSATKAFVTFFSQALEYEYRDSGITVQAVQPGPVPTNMTGYSRRLSKPGFMTPSARTYVSSALRTLGHTKVTAGTWDHALMTFLVKQLNEELATRAFNKFSEFVLNEFNEGGPKKTN